MEVRYCLFHISSGQQAKQADKDIAKKSRAVVLLFGGEYSREIVEKQIAHSLVVDHNPDLSLIHI